MSRHDIMMEYSALNQPNHCPLGMYVLPERQNPNKWHILLFLHKGYYSPSLLRLLLTIPSSYPNNPPTLHSLTDIFHPLVDPQTGLFNLEGRFPKWRGGSGNGRGGNSRGGEEKRDWIFHILHYVKSVFKRQGLEGLTEKICLNNEAYRMYRHQNSLFTTLARQSAQLSMSDSSLYDHPIQHRGLAIGEPSERFSEEEIRFGWEGEDDDEDGEGGEVGTRSSARRLGGRQQQKTNRKLLDDGKIEKTREELKGWVQGGIAPRVGEGSRVSLSTSKS